MPEVRSEVEMPAGRPPSGPAGEVLLASSSLLAVVWPSLACLDCRRLTAVLSPRGILPVSGLRTAAVFPPCTSVWASTFPLYEDTSHAAQGPLQFYLTTSVKTPFPEKATPEALVGGSG